RLREASLRYREAALYAHAARAAEEAGDSVDALTMYEQLARAKEATGEPYLAGLAALNAGRLAAKLNQAERARAQLSIATRLLEEEGDRKEQSGERDAAFRCYLSMIQI